MKRDTDGTGFYDFTGLNVKWLVGKPREGISFAESSISRGSGGFQAVDEMEHG